MSTPDVTGLPEVVDALRAWQHDRAPVQLHPGDLGWFWRFGAAQTAAAVRRWCRDGRILAVGLLDGPELLRMALAPDAGRDDELARRLVADVSASEAGVLQTGPVSVEARFGERFRDLLLDHGWTEDDPWTPLSRSLIDPVNDCGLRIEVIGPERANVRTAVQRAAFVASTFNDECWQAMAAGVPYADAQCLVGYNDQDTAVAAVTVWSAGPGRPGLIEPMGVVPDHRGRGHGRAITVAAAAALRELGASEATVCTPSTNVGAVACYRSAGFHPEPDVRDLRRAAEVTDRHAGGR
ncbi:MAG: GNAT family N-acetyltransferase [Nakamurella sp.]